MQQIKMISINTFILVIIYIFFFFRLKRKRFYSKTILFIFSKTNEKPLGIKFAFK